MKNFILTTSAVLSGSLSARLLSAHTYTIPWRLGGKQTTKKRAPRHSRTWATGGGKGHAGSGPAALTQINGLRVSRIGLPALNFIKVALYSASLLTAALAPPDLLAQCLAVSCAPNKVVACDQDWSFDTPIVITPPECNCHSNYAIVVLSTVTNGNCLQYDIGRTWAITNDCGEYHSCAQTVSVINTNQPVFQGATNIDLYSCGSTQVFFNVTATESCCGSLPVTCGPPSGYSFPPGPTLVGCSTTDCCGRTFNTSFEVYVHPLGGLAAYCPDKHVAFGETNWTFDPPSVSDDCCPGNYTFVPQTPVTNQASGPMIITEVWGVTDGCSQSTYCTETVYVTNTLPYSIPWHKVAGGGGASPGGVYAVSGTGGQWDAGKLSGGNLNLDGGFWVFALAQPAAPVWTLRITSIARSGNDLLLSFTSQAGHSYNVLATSDLNTGTWVTLLTGIPGTGAIIQATLPNAFTQPRQFYRVQQAQ